jgi:NitT/TauT family transport system substrate-binding protein
VRRSRILMASLVLLAACGTADTPSTPAPGGSGGAPTPVKLQLQWFYQAQFAGYIAAVDQGFYREQGLDVQLLEGGVDIVPQTVLAQGKADYAVAWVPKALASREQGANITDVGQIFARSGTYQVAWKDSGITTAADFKGKKVGNWGFGNEFELFAGMTKAGLDPGKDVTLVQQQFDMQALLKKEIDVAQAMSYNEYAQLLEATNPATGKLYTPEDFAVIDWKKEGTAMLQDAVWANTDKLDDPVYQQQTVKFLLDQGLGLLPGQRGGVPRPRGGPRLQARQEPPAVADERGQQAGLAGARGHRHGGRGGLEADRGPVPDDEEPDR